MLCYVQPLSGAAAELVCGADPVAGGAPATDPTTAAVIAEAVRVIRRMDLEEVLLPVLIQLCVILLAARLFGEIFRRLKLSAVIGEVAAGMILGPSLCGWLFPQLTNFVFHPHPAEGIDPAFFDAILHWVFTILSQIGLVLLLFLVGLEFDFSHLRKQGSSAAMISAMGIILPFSLGLLLADFISEAMTREMETGRGLHPWGFRLFLGTAMSITALPILGRLMMELNLTRSTVGTVTISSAAMDDAAGWILLASVSALVRGEFEPLQTLQMIGGVLLFTGLMIFVARSLLLNWSRRVCRQGELSSSGLAMLLVLIFCCGITTNRLGIFAIFGAFLLGALLSANVEFREAVHRRLSDFVTVFFLPIFFTYTGLRTDIGSLHSLELWGICGAVLTTAIIGKWAGCGVTAWCCGFPPREANCIGVLMNTRGLMELIVINVGYELGVIPRSLFCMLVIMALVTSIMTTPLVLWLVRGTSLEPLVRDSSLGTGTMIRADRSGSGRSDLPTPGDTRTETATLST